jgi:hypothetical protein
MVFRTLVPSRWIVVLLLPLLEAAASASVRLEELRLYSTCAPSWSLRQTQPKGGAAWPNIDERILCPTHLAGIGSGP